ncbi:uncharacterized protein LOC117111194 [Anneissia japonica]|uniref:uncharacterized protein LOC117111194 n=1 Tax=Anneissia japonica TaxID=1529436 RepID=UPI001425885F|nr:uncharacterized protein LOC117111194 [Anneissia japonica]
MDFELAVATKSSGDFSSSRMDTNNGATMGAEVSKRLTGIRKVVAVNAFRTAGVALQNKRLVDKIKRDEEQPITFDEEDLNFPPLCDRKPLIDKNASIEGHAKTIFPIQSYNKLNFNVNAGAGGGTALLSIVRFNSDKGTAAAQVQLVRCGSSGNHFETLSLAKTGEHSNSHSDDTSNEFDVTHTNSVGDLRPMALYGTSHTSLLSNLPRFGNCQCGIVLLSSKNGVIETGIKVNNPSINFSLLVLCSASPVKGTTPCNAYIVHSQPLSSVPFSSEKSDLWKFTGKKDLLKIKGPQNSSVTIFVNSPEDIKLEITGQKALVNHTQSFVGSEETILLNSLNKLPMGGMLVLCSHGLGADDDKTTSALYLVSLNKSKVDCTYVQGMSGTFSSGNAWTIYHKNDNLVAVGPAGPCRYTILSNILSPVEINETQLAECLVTGEQQPMRSGLVVYEDKLMGWLTKVCQVKLMMNGKVLEVVPLRKLLKQPDGRFGFCRELTEEERKPGLKLIQAFALVKDIHGVDKTMELGGSPHTMVIQPKGVHVAVNCGGPAYEALSGVVFQDTQTLFRMHKEQGLFCVRKLYDLLSDDELTAVIGNTYDGFIGGTTFSNHPGFFDRMEYEFEIPNGFYNLRLYGVSKTISFINELCVQGKNVAHQVTDALEKIRDKVPDMTLKYTDIGTVVDDGKLLLSFESFNNNPTARLAGLLITDMTYKVPQPSDDEVAKEIKSKIELADNLFPLDRSLAKKQIKIAGWSSNLLENASGERADMSGWNYGGDWKIVRGGDNTESQFCSSHMNCVKNQEISLLAHFTEEHLDSSPEIQASESFHEGSCGGGFYSLTITLMDADGDVIATQTTDEKGSIKSKDWIRESFTFKNYGKGLRFISFQTTAKDDKFWAGHYGAYASAACLRVKNEVEAAAGDLYDDVLNQKSEKPSIDDIIRGLLEEHKEVLTEIQQNEEEIIDFDKPLPNVVNDSFPISKPVDRRQPKKRREVRVFVSSTFRDFQEEREALIKKAFRELNRLCTERGICFTYVDLRWGITKEQSEDGQTISICLREIDKCPYFICLLGDRYGWSQKEVLPDKLLNRTYNVAIENHSRFNWIDSFRFDTSVTRLEALYGALMNKESSINRSFFYVRDNQLKEDDLKIMQEIQADMEAKEREDKERKEKGGEEKEANKTEKQSGNIENPKEDNNKTVSESESDGKKKALESFWHFEQQQKFRKIVEESGMNVRKFKSVEEVQSKILEDLTRCVDEDFPPGTELTGLQREREAHEAFAEVRRRIYIGREDYFKAIDDYVSQDTDEPFVILGRSGSGKSALIANWCTRYEEKKPNHFVFMHFIGSSAESASHLNLLRRLYQEMKQFFNFPQPVPSSDRNLVLDLPSWLKQAGNRGKVMLVLDALNQLDTGAGTKGDEQELIWLPKKLPDGVKMVLSTLPGKAYDAVQKNKWPTFEIFPLKPSEKKQIITDYMTLYAKTLSEEQMEMVIKADQTSNPLYLKSLMDEIRIYGSFYQLTNAIKTYLRADDPGKLFVKILERLETDFESGPYERPGLVKDTTTAIWCSNNGMTEAELTEYLKVSSRIWSPFYLSLEGNLINRNGVLNFFHDHLRQAVERKYLGTPDLKRKCYIGLANFFNKKDIDHRYTEELPFLLSQAGDLKRLRATILNVAVFQKMMATEEGKFELIKAWQLLGGYEQVEQAYLDKLANAETWDNTRDKASLIRSMAGFFMQLGLQKGARSLYERLLDALETKYQEDYSTIVYHHKKYTYKRQCVHTEVLEIGELSYGQGRLEDGLIHHLWDMQLTQNEVGLSHPRVAAILNNIALVYDDKNEKVAGDLFKGVLNIMVQTYGQNHVDVAVVRYNLGAFLFANNLYERARYQFNEAQRIFELFLGNDHPDTRLTEVALEKLNAIVK